jgi:outer membrane immunogenic protein
MKKLFIAGMATVALYCAPAFAAPPAPFNWSGVNGGAMDFTTDGNFPFHPNPGNPPFMWRTDRKEAALGGLHGGFQGQWGNFVAGIEGGFEVNLNPGYGTRPGLDGATDPCGFGTAGSCQARINDILSVGPRVGFAMNQFLVYGTGGYARYMLQTRGIFNNSGITFDEGSGHHYGWYLGGGLEMLVTNGFTIGVEYKHYNFGAANNSIIVNAFSNPLDTERVKTSADAVFLRLTIK